MRAVEWVRAARGVRSPVSPPMPAAGAEPRESHGAADGGRE
jgi:hypothetical protein